MLKCVKTHYSRIHVYMYRSFFHDVFPGSINRTGEAWPSIMISSTIIYYVYQCSRKLPTLYRTFGQTEYESLSDRQNFCLTEKQSARFWKNHQGRRVCVCVCGGGVIMNFK